MIDRILTGWTFMRAFYLLIGAFIVIQSILEHQWVGLLFGGYFAAMGLFAFGCASGNCYGGKPMNDQQLKDNSSIQDIDYDEIK